MPSETPDGHQSNEKERLELEKLRADTARAKLEAKCRLSVLQPVAAIVISIVATVTAWANGWFSTKLESLDNKKAEVQRNIDSLQSDRSELKTQKKALDAQVQKLKDAVKGYKSAYASIADQIKGLQAKVNALQPQAAAGIEYKRRFLALLAEVQKAGKTTPDIKEIEQPSNPRYKQGTGQSSGQGSDSDGFAAIMLSGSKVFSGRIVGLDGIGMVGVTVQAFELTGAKPLGKAISGEDGNYSLTITADALRAILSTGVLATEMRPQDFEFDCSKDGFHVYNKPNHMTAAFSQSYIGLTTMAKNGTPDN